MRIPSLLLKQLYTFGSLKNNEEGVQFSIKNRLSDATFTGLKSVLVDGKEIPPKNITLHFDDGKFLTPDQVSSKNPIEFPLRKEISISAKGNSLEKGAHKIEVVFDTKPYGKLHLKVTDSISDIPVHRVRV
ncbi:MAG: hydroxymethylglutaryl-CoA reductase, partial [Calditrichia bacterium]